MTNLFIDSKSEAYQYQALAWNSRKPDSPVLQVDLGKNHGQAIAKYNKLVRKNNPENDYTTGVMAHTALRAKWQRYVTNLTGAAVYHDVY